MPRNLKSSVGLDIGNFSVKVVELENKRPGKVKLCSFAMEKISGEASESQIIDAIRGAFGKAKLDLREVNISISGPEAVVRYIHLPKMSGRDLLSSLKLEADKYIPYKLDEVVVDYHILKSKISSRKGQMTVLLVAAKRDSIEKRVKMVAEAGLEVCLIDVDSFALMNAFKVIPAVKEEKLTALLNVGVRATNVNILKDGISYFSRDIMIGGADLTRAISGKLNIEFSQAERLKCSSASEDEEVFEAVRIKLNNLLDELRLSFDYCEKQVEEDIGMAYLSGGGSQLKGLDKFLSENLDLEVEIWNPAANLQLAPNISREDLEKDAASLAVGIGLALAEKRVARSGRGQIW